jgi:hypothetical protein
VRGVQPPLHAYYPQTCLTFTSSLWDSSEFDPNY